MGELPYLIIKIKNNYYAINSKDVCTIMQYPGSNPVPESNPEMVGVLPYREKIATVLDLRIIFNQKSLQDEYQDFQDMLEKRKSDHIYWVEELKQALKKEEEFALATDPSKCAFGQWYDNYKNDNNVIMHHLRKIKEPHDSLHLSAIEALKCKHTYTDIKEQKECEKRVLSKIVTEFMPQVLGLLEEAKTLFKSAFKEMVVILREENPLAILVDEVVSVEYLEKGELLKGIYNKENNLLSYRMKSQRNDNIIFLLSTDELYSRY